MAKGKTHFEQVPVEAVHKLIKEGDRARSTTKSYYFRIRQRPSSARGQSGTSKDGRLDGWKEIADYLQRGVRTAQRWHRSLQLPAHRVNPANRSQVFAYKVELDRWINQFAARDRNGRTTTTDARQQNPDLLRIETARNDLNLAVGRHHAQVATLHQRIREMMEKQEQLAKQLQRTYPAAAENTNRVLQD